jgi:tetratricopeptide (TPR) repeat protein
MGRSHLAVPGAWALVVLWAAVAAADTAPDGSAACRSATEVRFQSALEERLFGDAGDGRLDQFSPLGASLVAGGVEDGDTLRRYEQKAQSLADELRRSGTVAGTPRRQVEAIFEFLHRRVLRGGYDLSCTDLRRTLDAGRFNCISATVLFNYFAVVCGFECRGLEMPGHAMSRVVLSDGAVDVETTCARWFSAGGRATAAVPRAPLPHGAYADSDANGDRAKAREVSPIQLAAMVYYNRGVDLLGQRRFSEAAVLNAKALRLDPANTLVRGNLLATLNNWSIALGDEGRFAEAIGLLRQGFVIDRTFAPLTQNFIHVHHQWIEHLCREGRVDEALALLSRAAAEMPECEYFRSAQDEVRDRRVKAAR